MCGNCLNKAISSPTLEKAPVALFLKEYLMKEFYQATTITQLFFASNPIIVTVELLLIA